MDAFGFTPSLRPRADADTTSSGSSATGSDGCVTCPSTSGTCPQCPSGQECNLTTRTCNSCPEYICVKVSGSGSITKSKVGGIVGGVVGGLVALALALFLYYMLIYRKKHPRLDDSDGYESKYEMESQNGANEESFTSGENLERPALPGAGTDRTKNRRLSSYESFMRPPGHSKRGGRQREVSRTAPGASAAYSGEQLSKRNSIATTISTTNASNILPIAYIPGVTIRPTKNNTRSIFSYDTDSVFSDFAGIDNASIVQDRDAQAKNTMTAVKVQPKLVNVTRIDEDIAEEDEEELEKANDTSFWSEGTSGNPAEADSDSDVDSDIGEINRATSTRRVPNRSVFDSANHSEAGFPTYESADVSHDAGGEAVAEDEADDDKSFVLDIARES